MKVKIPGIGDIYPKKQRKEFKNFIKDLLKNGVKDGSYKVKEEEWHNVKHIIHYSYEEYDYTFENDKLKVCTCNRIEIMLYAADNSCYYQ